jgi:hypothetical protein
MRLSFGPVLPAAILTASWRSHIHGRGEAAPLIPEVQIIVDQITGERVRFAAFCVSLTDDELARAVPGSDWVVKDFISHLATIDRPVATWFRSIQTGAAEPPRPSSGDRWDVDRYNDAAVADRRGRSVESILAEAAGNRAAMLDVLAGLTEEQVLGEVRFGGDSKRPPSDIQLLRYLQGWARHDIIHVSDMLRALPERREDRLVQEWMAEPGVQALVDRYQRLMA